MENQPKKDKEKEDMISFSWKPIYAWVLLANLVYILFFYLIMISNR